jgi:hypothetical protein
VDVANLPQSLHKKSHKIDFVAGHVEKSGTKKVVIKPVGLEYAGETLAVR